MRFNDQKFALEYDDRLTRENYPGELFRFISDGLDGHTSLIDVGAGTGFFALPLARQGKTITAIEPSAVMIEIMKSKMTADISGNIIIVQSDWESWEGPLSEALICVHSLYPMKNPEWSLSLMKKRSRCSLVVVRTHEGRKTVSDVIRKKLIPGHAGPDYPQIIRDFLSRIGVPYSERLISETKYIMIDDIDRDASFYSLQLFKDESRADEIKTIIIDSCEKTSRGHIFTAHHRDILFTF